MTARREQLERLAALLREIDVIIQSLRQNSLAEAEAQKPLTPDQARKRAEKQQQRNRQVSTIQRTAAMRVGDIRAKPL